MSAYISKVRAGARPGGYWLAMIVALLTTSAASGQAVVSSVVQRPFVIGFRPVVGNGVVGGVLVDARGVVSRADVDTTGRLRAEIERALQPTSADLSRASGLRKISLRRLEAEVARHRDAARPLPDEVLHLAGLQRIRYLFVDPLRQDLVIAGPAEGWRVDSHGEVVGHRSGRPVMRLDDLIVTLQSAADSEIGAILCSIDPTPDGLQRLTRLTKRRLAPGAKTLAQLTAALGPQQVTVGGVPADCHFARVMVSADFLMKRLAMNFEPPPIEGFPSYMELLQGGAVTPQGNLMPRWWMAPGYESLTKDPHGLAWELRGTGVQVLTEDTLFTQSGAESAGRSHPQARRFAESMTDRYEALAEALPVFARLQQLMDLAVISTLVFEHDLRAKADCALPLLTSTEQLTAAVFAVPRTVDTQASFVRQGDRWIVSLSGGVEMDASAVLKQTETDAALSNSRTKALGNTEQSWWWD